MAAIDLTTVDAVKEAITLPDGEASLDLLIPDYITQASRVIMNYTKRQFKPLETATTKRFTVDSYRVDFTPFDLQTQPAPVVVLHPEQAASSITLNDGSTGALAQYMMKPINPHRGVYQSLQLSGYLVIVSQTLMAFNFALMDVTGTWGFNNVPDAVIRACNITVGAWLTRTAPGSSVPYGIPQGVGQGAVGFRNDWHMPWAAKKMLEDYRRGSARWSS